MSGVTASVYVAGIRSFHLEQGYEDPCKEDQFLNMMLKGFMNETKPLTTGREPLTSIYLIRLREKLFESSLTKHDKAMLWSAFTMAFFGMMRVSEYTSPFLHKMTQSTLLRKDLDLTENCLKITLRKDKTHQRSAPPPIMLTRIPSALCPVSAVEKYLKLRPVKSNSPLYVSYDGTFLTRQRVNNELRLHLGPKFTSHSLRSGAATTASSAGCTSEQIRVMGRWKSDVSNRYVRPDYINMGKLMSNMARLVLQSSFHPSQRSVLGGCAKAEYEVNTFVCCLTIHLPTYLH